jgi:hypothetical protein
MFVRIFFQGFWPCLECRRFFTTQKGLANHQRVCSAVAKRGVRGKKRRLSHDMSRKAEAQDMTTRTTPNGQPVTQKSVADFLEVHPSLISKWSKPANVFITNEMILRKKNGASELVSAVRPNFRAVKTSCTWHFSIVVCTKD